MNAVKSLLIKNIWLNGRDTDIHIEGNIIRRIASGLDVAVDRILDGKGKAVIPGFVNAHGHAAMTLFRGWGDNMPLEQWLQEKIWPYEAKLSEEDVYWGARLACLEMIKSGTTCFNDMYWHFHGTAKAVEEMGMRAILSSVIFDHFDPEIAEKSKHQTERHFERFQQQYSSRIHFALGPHAIYTLSAETWQWIKQFSEKHQLLIHTHAAETQTEHAFSCKQFNRTPIRYLHDLGMLSPQLTLAHCLWIDEEEIELLAASGTHVVHNPNSNLKLASGYKFKYQELRDAGVNVCIGTDGCSSSNNLDMFEATKVASLLQKAWRFDSTSMPAQEALACATENGGKAFGLSIGKVAEGFLADLSLVDLCTPALTPHTDFISNLVYAANGSCVDTVICDGRVIMENKHVQGEEEIMCQANKIAQKLFQSS